MNKRKAKKTYSPGTLVAVQGTHCVFISLGFDGINGLDAINGIDIVSGKFVNNINGKARRVTKKECDRYWKLLKSQLKR